MRDHHQSVTAEVLPQPVVPRFDPVLLAVLSNRMQSIVREMQNTLLRSGRSAVVNTARDFSCAIVTKAHELVSAADGLPVHIFGSHLMTKAVADLHPHLSAGDAFLHNDPYRGGTHAADHTIIVPVFADSDLEFFTVAKAHQADCGNSLPTTMMPRARDVYEEGALVFPAVQVQRDSADIDDVLRMCRARIRVPDQWYGDYLAMLGAARIGEQRLQALCAQYGVGVIRGFVEVWFNYSEQQIAREIGSLRATRLRAEGCHDPQPDLEDGIPLLVDLEIDSEAGRIVIDLRDNIDCVSAGVNLSEACAISSSIAGVFHSLDPRIPPNAGSFRRIDVLLRENCIAGIPRFPHSCSAATTNVSARLTSIIQRAFGEGVGDRGQAEGACGLGPSSGGIAGNDPYRHGEPYVNLQLFAAQGGPAAPTTDGWVTYGACVTAGLMNRDSVEVVEQKYPLYVDEIRIRTDSGGAGEYRGAPGTVVAFGPRAGSMTVRWNLDGRKNPPLGVRGGGAGGASVVLKRDVDATESEILVDVVDLAPGEVVVHLPNGGGGFGDPLDRHADAVLADVRAQFVSIEAARDTYGVVLKTTEGELAVDTRGTAQRRAALRTSEGRE
jgi:N-methylhydantoinase B